MKYDIINVLDCLDFCRIRATYTAVGEVIGIPARSVGGVIGSNSTYGSWVVSREYGTPTGYEHAECHAELFKRDKVIDCASELRSLLERDFAVLS